MGKVDNNNNIDNKKNKLKLSLIHATESIRKKFQKLHSDRIEKKQFLNAQYRPITRKIGKLIDIASAERSKRHPLASSSLTSPLLKSSTFHTVSNNNNNDEDLSNKSLNENILSDDDESTKNEENDDALYMLFENDINRERHNSPKCNRIANGESINKKHQNKSQSAAAAAADFQSEDGALPKPKLRRKLNKVFRNIAKSDPENLQNNAHPKRKRHRLSHTSISQSITTKSPPSKKLNSTLQFENHANVDKESKCRVVLTPLEKLHELEDDLQKVIASTASDVKKITKQKANTAVNEENKAYSLRNTPARAKNSGSGIFDPNVMVYNKATNSKSYIYWNNPNELCDRLRLLIASQQAGHTGHQNEIISIVEELRECGILM